MSDVALASPLTVAGRTPKAVVTPATLTDLKALLRQSSDRSFVPIGGGTAIERGGPPRDGFELLDLREALGGEIQHQRDDLTVVVPGSATIDEINDQLAAAGQWIPLDPALPSLASIGGVVAVGVNGPLRSRFGLPRDLVLGMTVIRSDGELVKAGGRVVKNVTGYDLMRLWCGSLGTLGIVSEVALRALPLASRAFVCAEFDDIAHVVEAARAMSTADIRPLFFDALRCNGGWRGVAAVIDAAMPAAIELLGGTCDGDAESLYIRSRDLGAESETAVAVSGSTTLRRVAALASAVAALEPSQCVVRPLVGVVRASWSADACPDPATFAGALENWRSLVRPVAGSMTVERMPAGYHETCPAWNAAPPSIDLMRRVKSAYDPLNMLNAGRFIDGI